MSLTLLFDRVLKSGRPFYNMSCWYLIEYIPYLLISCLTCFCLVLCWWAIKKRSCLFTNMSMMREYSLKIFCTWNIFKCLCNSFVGVYSLLKSIFSSGVIILVWVLLKLLFHMFLFCTVFWSICTHNKGCVI